MWSYYGSKTNIVDAYPPPRFDKIYEPFAGTAKYALKYFEHDVTLIDSYEVLVNIWLWLQKCSPQDILKLPIVRRPNTLNDVTWDCQEAKHLMGFIVGSGAESPRITPTSRKGEQRPNHINFNLNKIANNLYKIRHWKILLGDYRDCPNEKATYFIDPPYRVGGHKYVMSNRKINYSHLASWCMDRKGQVIVCENTKANWMHFRPLIKQMGSNGKLSTEAIWTNDKKFYRPYQVKIEI